MPKAILFVQSAPSSPEREAEYTEWYQGTHIPEVVALPGFVSGRLFKAENAPEGTPGYAAVYEIDCDDPSGAVTGIFGAAKEGKLNMSDSIAPGAMITYTEL